MTGGWWKVLLKKFRIANTFRIAGVKKRSKACLLLACNGTRLKNHDLLRPLMSGLGWTSVIGEKGNWITYQNGLHEAGLPYPSLVNTSYNTLNAFSFEVNDVHPNTFTVRFRTGKLPGYQEEPLFGSNDRITDLWPQLSHSED